MRDRLGIPPLDAKKVPKLNVQGLARRDKSFMQCFLPEPGCFIAATDLEAAEPAVVAHYAKDERYLFATRDGRGVTPYFDSQGILMIDDVYLMFGSSHSLTKDVTIQAVEKTDWGREAAKQFIISTVPASTADTWEDFATEGHLSDAQLDAMHREVTFFEQWELDADVVKDWPPLGRKDNKMRALAIIYGLGKKGIQSQEYQRGNIVTYKEATEIFNGFWSETFPGNKVFKDRITQRCATQGYLVNQFGYRLTPLKHKAFNYLIQSSVSGIVNTFCMLFFTRYPKAIYHSIIHDELIFSVPNDDEETAKRIFFECERDLNKLLNWSVEMKFGWKARPTFYVK